MRLQNILGVGFGWVALWAGPGLAQQIIPDATLGAESSRFTADFQGLVGVDGIEGGARRGNNLFHSFEEFGIVEGRSGYFVVDDLAVQNILARVTGTKGSEILGTLGTRALINDAFLFSPANLFLINPNGIIFGPNARLDVGTSFAATTASGVRFGEQGVFSAEQGNAPPLLTVQPDAFLFTRLAPAGIEMRANAPSPLGGNGFRVNDGQRLLLLGGDVGVDGGGVFALGGRVDVGAVAEPGTVRLQGDGSLEFADGLVRGTVRFEQGAVVQVDGIGGGDIGVTAGEIEVSGGSLLRGGIFPGFGTRDSRAGTVRLEATGTVTVAGAGRRVANVVGTGATGTGGDLVIRAREVVVQDGAQLSASTFGTGDAGNVEITAGDRVLFQDGFAFSSVATGGEGKGGNVVIDAPVLEVLDGAALVASTRGTGDAGNVQITAGDRVLFQDGNAFSSVATGGEGKGGNIVIAAPVLEVRDGAQLIASTDGKGDAGNVLITASERILFQDGDAFSRVEAGGEGKGGNVVIDAPVLEVRDGAALVANTEGTGDAGNVLITASDRVLFQGTNSQFPSAAFSSVEAGGEGNGGNVVIEAPVLEVRDGAQLIASTDGKGDAGNVLITASERVLFQDGNAFSSVATGGEGKGGNIVIAAPVLEVRDGAQLIASTDGKGDAGNVLITASERILFQDGDAFSRVEAGGEGKGGNVVIDAPVLEVRDGAALVANTEGTGDAGNVLITASDRVLFQDGNAFSSVAAGGEGKGGNVVIDAPVLEVLDGAQLLANTRGTGDAGNVQITAGERVLFQNGFAFSSVATGGEGQGGNVVIDAPVLEVLDGAQLVAGTSGTGDAGNVLITAGDRVLLNGTNPTNGRSSAILTSNGTPTVNAGTGTGGNISISAPQLQVSNGAVLNAKTVNDQSGGDITLNLATLNLLSGGQILTTSDSTGPAGTVTLNATDNIRISGTDPTYTARRAEFGTAVAPVTENSGIYIRSTANGPAGNLILNSPQLRLSDNGQIIADSDTATGGNLSFNLNQALLLEGNSLISATAGRNQGAGDGGNINIISSFVIGLPNNNSDIIANAFSGSGGNITINANAILNFQLQDEPNIDILRTNRTNDISASSQFGTNGILTLSGLNTDPSQGTTQLPTSPTDPSNQIDRSCDPQTTRTNRFIITGRGGIPLSPDEPYPDILIPAWVLLPNTPSPQHRSSPISSTSPLEAENWHRDTRGNVVLTTQSKQRSLSSPQFHHANCVKE